MFLIFDKVAVCGWGLWEEIAKILMGQNFIRAIDKGNDK